MGALTALQPKCLCALADRPILAWTLDALRANGVERVLAIGGWRHPLLVDWVDQVIVNDRWEQSNMVRSLLLADAWLSDGPTLIVYGDGAYGARAIGAALQGGRGDLCLPVDRRWLSLWKRRFADPLSDAESLRILNGRITNIGQRPSALHDIDGQFMGLLRANSSGWERITRWLRDYEREFGSAAVDRLDTTGLLHRLVDAGETILCTDVEGGWVEIDSATDIAAAEAGLLDPTFLHDFRH